MLCREPAPLSDLRSFLAHVDDSVSEVGASGHHGGPERLDDALHERSPDGVPHVLRVAGQRPRVLEVPDDGADTRCTFCCWCWVIFSFPVALMWLTVTLPLSGSFSRALRSHACTIYRPSWARGGVSGAKLLADVYLPSSQRPHYARQKQTHKTGGKNTTNDPGFGSVAFRSVGTATTKHQAR